MGDPGQDGLISGNAQSTPFAASTLQRLLTMHAVLSNVHS